MARPTHVLRMARKPAGPDGKAGYGHDIGVGWLYADGAIGVVLNPGVVLSHRDCEDYWITLRAIDTALPPSGTKPNGDLSF